MPPFVAPTPWLRRKATPFGGRRPIRRAGHRSRRAGHVRTGVPQEPGRPCRLRREEHGHGTEGPVQEAKSSGLPAAHASAQRAERTRRCGDGQREPKDNEGRVTDGKESERFTVPRNRGNLTRRDPGEG